MLTFFLLQVIQVICFKNIEIDCNCTVIKFRVLNLGGPLQLQVNGLWRVVGIVSWGIRCAEPGMHCTTIYILT